MSAAKIRANAVNSAKLAPGAVRAADLGAGSVGGAALAQGSVTAAKLAAGAVTGPALGNGSVTTEKLGPNAVTGAKIAGGTVTAANIVPGQVVTGKGELVSGRLRLLVTPGGPPSVLLALPGIATFSVNCPDVGPKQATVANTSPALLTLARSAIEDPGSTPVVGASALAPGASTSVSAAGVQMATWQLGYTDSGGVPHVATIVIAASQAGPDCLWSGQALTTG